MGEEGGGERGGRGERDAVVHMCCVVYADRGWGKKEEVREEREKQTHPVVR